MFLQTLEDIVLIQTRAVSISVLKRSVVSQTRALLECYLLAHLNNWLSQANFWAVGKLCALAETWYPQIKCLCWSSRVPNPRTWSHECWLPFRWVHGFVNYLQTPVGEFWRLGLADKNSLGRELSINRGADNYFIKWDNDSPVGVLPVGRRQNREISSWFKFRTSA